MGIFLVFLYLLFLGVSNYCSIFDTIFNVLIFFIQCNLTKICEVIISNLLFIIVIIRLAVILKILKTYFVLTQSLRVFWPVLKIWKIIFLKMCGTVMFRNSEQLGIMMIYNRVIFSLLPVGKFMNFGVIFYLFVITH